VGVLWNWPVLVPAEPMVKALFISGFTASAAPGVTCCGWLLLQLGETANNSPFGLV
jgi:hypothetical protein